MVKKLIKKDVEEWISNFRYEIIFFPENYKKEKCIFRDKIRNISFAYFLIPFRKCLFKNSDHVFFDSKDEIKKRREKTNLKKFGFKSNLESPVEKEKIKQTFVKKYKVDNPFKSQEIRDKIKNTNIKKYGTEFVTKNLEIKNKIKETNIKNFGVVAPSQNEIVKSKIKETRIKNGSTIIIEGKTIPEFCSIKGVNENTFYKIKNKFNLEKAINLQSKKSSIESLIKSILESNEIDFRFNNKIRKYLKYRFDFLLHSKKIVIECNGLYWHSDKLKNKNYHKQKRLEAINEKYFPIFFNEDEIINKPKIVESIIRNKLNLNQKIFARKCFLDQTQDASFFEENHLMGSGVGRVYCLKFNNEIIAAIQVKYKNKKKKELEVSRFCTKNNVSVIGGFDKLIKYVIKKEDPKSIITFIDKRYGSGEYLEKLGWKFVNENLSFKWTDFKQTFHRMKFPGNSGYEFGLAKIWDCGQAKWELKVC